MKRILVPCDFSAPAQAAFATAVAMAQKSNGSVPTRGKWEGLRKHLRLQFAKLLR